jgi:hypothetical protein
MSERYIEPNKQLVENQRKVAQYLGDTKQWGESLGDSRKQKWRE